MQRTVEGELVPMAQELGLGVLPWGPLKSGALTGKYTRANGAKMPGERGAYIGDFSEKQFDIVDAVAKVAKECNSSSPTVALAWLRSQPGVQSIIIGARSLEQLDGNLKALDLTLTPEQIASLNTVSKPVLNFPADFLAASPSFCHAGATVNDISSHLIPGVPRDDTARY
jgi:aryl-alcohol dehydrogenase-like predicted oxidoreductase